MTDAELEQRFLEHLRVERQLSAETLKNYGRDLSTVRKELNRLESQSWLNLSDKPCGAPSLNCTLTAFRDEACSACCRHCAASTNI